MKKENKINIISRWIALVPAVCITWYACTTIVLGLTMLYLWKVNSLTDWLMSLSNDFTRFALIGLPTIILTGIAEFFITRAIAPKYKIWLSCIVTVLSIVCSCYTLWGLAHIAY